MEDACLECIREQAQLFACEGGAVSVAEWAHQLRPKHEYWGHAVTRAFPLTADAVAPTLLNGRRGAQLPLVGVALLEVVGQQQVVTFSYF